MTGPGDVYRLRAADMLAPILPPIVKASGATASAAATDFEQKHRPGER